MKVFLDPYHDRKVTLDPTYRFARIATLIAGAKATASPIRREYFLDTAARLAEGKDQSRQGLTFLDIEHQTDFARTYLTT